MGSSSGQGSGYIISPINQWYPIFNTYSQNSSSQIFTWNTDAYGYGSETTSLYQSHPWVLALLPEGRALGVLADTTRRCEVCLIFSLFVVLYFLICVEY